MMMKYDRLAVLICGELRSWARSSEYIFETVEAVSDNPVDYYFVTWNETRDFWWPEEKSINTRRPVLESEIVDKFAGKSLIGYRLIDQQTLPRYETTYYYVTYLTKIATTLKRRYEFDNMMCYDQIIEIRPDLFMPYLKNNISCDDFEYQSGLVFNRHGTPMIGDFYIRTNSFGNDVVGNRYYYCKSRDLYNFRSELAPPSKRLAQNHWVLYDFFQSRRLLPSKFPNETDGQIPIRPNFPDNLRNYSYNYLQSLDEQWIKSQWT
jgi:hypothetical protein